MYKGEAVESCGSTSVQSILDENHGGERNKIIKRKTVRKSRMNKRKTKRKKKRKNKNKHTKNKK